MTRNNIFLRDNHQCQYCLKKLPAKELTRDHVIPRSRGGAMSWDNIVAACAPCNRNKGGRTPAEARMKILDMVSDDPIGRNSDWIREQMKLLQKAGAVKPRGFVSAKELFEYGAKLLYLDSVPSEALTKMGKAPGDLIDAIEELKNELINRNIIDPDNLVWPNLPQKIGDEVVEAEEVKP